MKQCYRVLKKTGSIFLHCDRSASHYLRVALDEVFGAGNFRSEIVWVYRRWSNTKKGLLNSHQIIYFYSKSQNYKFNKFFNSYSPTTNIDQIFQKRLRDENGKSSYKISDDGNYELMDKKNGVPLTDVWEIPYLNPKARERVGYPTQKPILLLERIIELVTDKNDLVLDPFCGSGTTLVAAKLLNRKYIGIDISEEAISISRKRLENPVKSESLLMKKGKAAYCNQTDNMLQILSRLDAIPVQRNKGIDGFLKDGDSIRPIPIKIQRTNETLDSARELLVQACKVNEYKIKILVKTNDKCESTLFDYKDDREIHDVVVVEDVDDFIQNKSELLATIIEI